MKRILIPIYNPDYEKSVLNLNKKLDYHAIVFAKDMLNYCGVSGSRIDKNSSLGRGWNS